jgi:predicted Fe-Mo cluster-binding NifX family protein
MKIAVSAIGNTLESMVDPRFGRCAYFIIVDVEGNEIKNFEAVQNQGVTAMGGAGIQAAQLVANKGTEVVISGNMGPNAFGVLSQTGIKIVTGIGGITVKEVVERYLKGELKETKEPTSSGIGGRGMGLGRGTGGGRGQTGGQGRGRNW